MPFPLPRVRRTAAAPWLAMADRVVAGRPSVLTGVCADFTLGLRHDVCIMFGYGSYEPSDGPRPRWDRDMRLESHEL